MQMLVHQLAVPGDTTFRHIDDVIPWFEKWLPEYPEAIAQRPGPRFFKTHLPLGSVPRQAKCIYLLRDPRDTCVSYYYHLTSLQSPRPPLSTFVDTFLNGRVPNGSWLAHLTASVGAKRTGAVLFIAYDDIVTQRAAVIDRVAAFCGRHLTPEQHDLVFEHTSHAFMRRHNDKFEPRFARGASRGEETPFVRRGVSGSWTDDLSPELAAKIDRRVGEGLEALGTELPMAYRAALQKSATRLRGTVELTLDNSLDWWIRPPTLSDAAFELATSRPIAAVTQGDAVRLVLSFGGAAALVVPVAEVVEKTLCDGVSHLLLRFETIGDADGDRLVKHARQCAKLPPRTGDSAMRVDVLRAVERESDVSGGTVTRDYLGV
jgi:hypothetical protein